MITETTDSATGWDSPRGRAFLAARNAVIDECKQRKAEIDRECTERLSALLDEFQAGADRQTMRDVAALNGVDG